MDKIYKCTVVCSFRVPEKYEEYIPLKKAFYGIVGLKLPDGRMVKPIIGLEVASKDESNYRNISSETEMAKLGFEDLDYSDSYFEEWVEESENLENLEYEQMPIEQIPANMECRFESTRKIIESRLKEGK